MLWQHGFCYREWRDKQVKRSIDFQHAANPKQKVCVHLLIERQKQLQLFKMPADQIQYSEKYFDAIYEYRHVILPPDLTKHVPKSHLMTETEWRNLGVQQSPGWVHYMMHAPEPHVILFRRPRTDLEPDGGKAASATTAIVSTSAAASSATEKAPTNNVSVQG